MILMGFRVKQALTSLLSFKPIMGEIDYSNLVRVIDFASVHQLSQTLIVLFSYTLVDTPNTPNMEAYLREHVKE